MKSEQEIVLQKKMVIIFSLFIVTFTMGILNIQKNTVYGASVNSITTVHKNYISDENNFKVAVTGNVEPVKQRVTDDENVGNNTQLVEDGISTNEAYDGITRVASRGSYIRETNVPPTDYEKVINVRATAYCLCSKCTGKTPSSSGYGHTATGLVIVPGRDMKVISVDPNVIPLGSEVYVEGYGYAIAADTGGAIKGNKIDVYKDTHALALQWGVRNVNVYILKNET